MSRINDAVRRILRVKFRAGLFEHPYVDVSKADAAQLLPDAVAPARDAARSMVLLKNGNTLPLDPARNTAVIGPLADDDHAMLGPWSGNGHDEDAVSLLRRDEHAEHRHDDVRAGLRLPHTDPPQYNPADDCAADPGSTAVAAAKAADQVVLRSASRAR